MGELISCGSDSLNISEREYLFLETSHALRIIQGIEQSGIPYSAKYNDKQISLTYPVSEKKRVEEIILKSDRDNSMLIEKIHNSKNDNDTSIELFPEIADVLNMSVSNIESKPSDIQTMLTAIYVNFYYSDSLTIKEALGKVLLLNHETEKEISEIHEVKDNSNNTPTKRSDIHNDELTLEKALHIDEETIRNDNAKSQEYMDKSRYISRKERIQLAEDIRSKNYTQQKLQADNELERKK